MGISDHQLVRGTNTSSLTDFSGEISFYSRLTIIPIGAAHMVTKSADMHD
jgi:hypothetical protein